ncbi:hypothetical protein [Micromonospora parva]|uniref:hypothetical protein n=1 Tax=Micromonospora parva TaxID=1464048 RepID=UPI0033D352CA
MEMPKPSRTATSPSRWGRTRRGWAGPATQWTATATATATATDAHTLRAHLTV